MSSTQIRSSVFRKAARSGIAAAVLAAAIPAARAGDLGGYLSASNGKAVTDASGECWHTGEWHSGMRLGRCEPSAPAAAAPAREVLAAAPAPATRPAKAAPAPIRISVDTLFDFDSATLRPEGRAALQSLASRIDRSPYRQATVTGHADRLGTPGYNLLLSERRAQAVRAYLGTHGLQLARIGAKGVGSSEPATSPEQCKGLGRAALIRCLQPDRYAEIAVVSSAPTASAK